MKFNWIPVTRPFVPPLEDFQLELKKIWRSRTLTNNGPIHQKFEKALCNHLHVDNICLFANGTLALITALKALGLKGKVITTPFTSLATANSIVWNGLEPVFVDINENDFNINTGQIKSAIDHTVKAIMPVHIFGNPCDVVTIEEIATKNGLSVVYDAAHCFGVLRKGIPLCNFGDLSVLSFHATKVFNTIEGGAIICHDPVLKNHINALKNNGTSTENLYHGIGLNAKMNELQCAIGLSNLKHIDLIIKNRSRAVRKYRELLAGVNGLKTLGEIDQVKHNYSYFPIIIDPEKFGSTRDELYNYLRDKKIDARKYFFPLITDFPEFSKYKTGSLPVAHMVAENILCLPLYHDLTNPEIKLISSYIYEFNKHHSKDSV
jgi:dTDP-4-amino-4,6-dideoxygalactose transaminase